MSRSSSRQSIVLILCLFFQAVWGTGALYWHTDYNPIGQRYFEFQDMDNEGADAIAFTSLKSTYVKSWDDAHTHANHGWDASDDAQVSVDRTVQAITTPDGVPTVHVLSDFVSALGRAPYKPQWNRLA